MKVVALIALVAGAVLPVMGGWKHNKNGNNNKNKNRGGISEFVAFANRGSSSFGHFETRKESQTLATVDLDIGLSADEEASEPMYVSNTNPNCESDQDSNIAIGDRANDRFLFYNNELELIATVDDVCDGIFHSWVNSLNQLWVACDVDNTVTIIDTLNYDILSTIEIADVTGFKPHDVTANANGAFVTLLGTIDPDTRDIGYVIQYDVATYAEVARQEVGGDPHVYINDNSASLYVASQGGNLVYEMDAESGDLAILNTLDVNAAHGITSNDDLDYLYVTDITSSNGTNSLYVIDLDTFTNVDGSPFDSIVGNPHNVVIDRANKRLYVANSGQSSVAKYKLRSRTGAIKDGSGSLIFEEAGSVPFGIGLICVNDNGDSSDSSSDSSGYGH